MMNRAYRYFPFALSIKLIFTPLLLLAGNFEHITSSSQLRKECGSFLSSVLQLQTADQLESLFANAPVQMTSDSDYYQYFQQNRSILNPHYTIPYQLGLLNYQKELLCKQASQLLGKQNALHGALEIGTPGTYLSGILQHVGSYDHIYVMNEQQRLTDHVQAFSCNPSNSFLIYDTFLSLNNYEPINAKDIPDNSLDLCVCFIGLHHIPEEKIDNFVASIARILKPGGTFLLREHDAHNDNVKALAYAAHSLFNILVPNETIETELAEYRNFQPLTYWITILERHRLSANSERLLQDGDPTLNTLLTFTKQIENQEDSLAITMNKMHNRTDCRDLAQTYLTAPEWYNVDISQKYGSFINHTPFFEFPYIQSVRTYWKIYACSTLLAAKKQGYFNTLFSEYNFMNLFIGTTMTAEYIAKAIISLPVRLMYTEGESRTIQVLLHDSDNQINEIDPRITIVHKDDQTNLSLVNVPRYKEFLSIMQKIADTNIDIHEIAGNDSIACKVRYAASRENPFQTGANCTEEYSWTMPSEPEYIYAVITIQVSAIKQIIKQLSSEQIELLYIHDF